MKKQKEVKIVEVSEIDHDTLIEAIRRKCRALEASGKLAALTKDPILAVAVKQKAARPDGVSFDRLILELVKEHKLYTSDGRFWVENDTRHLPRDECRETPRPHGKKPQPQCKRTLSLFGEDAQ